MFAETSVGPVPPPPPRVYLHVGLPKTGTTYLQDMLWVNRDSAVRAGLLYPGDEQPAHFRAAVDLQPERYASWLEPATTGALDRLLGQARSWPGTSVISHELFTTATGEQVARVLSALSGTEVHIVCTARDLARQIPSSWQENIKTFQSMTYPDFLTALRTGEPAWISEQFWGFQDLPRVLRTWSTTVPPERVHVVTLPHNDSGGQLLWHRFLSVLGVDPARLKRTVPHANHSLTLSETELLRRVNLAIEDAEWSHYINVVKERFAETVLPQRRSHGHARIPLPEGDYGWVRGRAEEFVSEIRRVGYGVVGDLDELLPAQAGGVGGLELDDSGVLDVAVDAVAGLVELLPPPPTASSATDRVKRTLRAQYQRILGLRQGRGR